MPPRAQNPDLSLRQLERSFGTKHMEWLSANRRSCILVFNAPPVFAQKFKWRKWDLSRRQLDHVYNREETSKNYQTLNLLPTISNSLACLSRKWNSVIKSPRFLFLFFFFFLHFMHLLQIWAVITIKHFIFFGCLLQLVYCEQTLHSYKAINCISQMPALFTTVPVWLICRSGCTA